MHGLCKSTDFDGYLNTIIILKQGFAMKICRTKIKSGGSRSSMSHHIGFVSTRFCGTDGVTLEASKWAEIFKNDGYDCFWFAGELDRECDTSCLVPEAHFKDKTNDWICRQVFGKKARTAQISDEIHRKRIVLKNKLYRFIKQFRIDFLVVENALSIPMQIPLGLALTEVIAETQIPTICHHHDFFWERSRFSLNGVNDYLRMSFPPVLPSIRHIVINSTQQEELSLRTGIASTVIPNVMDFSSPPKINPERSRKFREYAGLSDDDIVILQPTRIVQRKGIEHAVELVKGLNDKRCKLIISHEAGDEGYEYVNWLKAHASDNGVDLQLVEVKIADPWNAPSPENDGFNLWDVYPNADFITYPSLFEGFGNAFMEAIYFKKPVLINRYATFIKDIEPCGFDLAVMDGFLTKDTIQEVREILFSEERRNHMVEHNYRVASKYFSFALLRRRLKTIMVDFFGESLNERRIKKKKQQIIDVLAM